MSTNSFKVDIILVTAFWKLKMLKNTGFSHFFLVEEFRTAAIKAKIEAHVSLSLFLQLLVPLCKSIPLLTYNYVICETCKICILIDLIVKRVFTTITV